jgi:16S rRNA processing protein RimM
MSVTTPEWVVVGKFGRAQGIKGLVRVVSFTEPRDNILQYPEWFIRKPKATWQAIKRLTEQMTPQYVFAQIEGYNSREEVSLLTNLEIAVPREVLANLDSGEHYWHDLIGMRVIHEAGVDIGVVDSILATGSNDVLVVIDKNKKRRLIPYLLDEVIQTIDRKNREITVCWDLDF